ncbi:MAG: tRNA (adenosine(37)-N6)-threonylcarbamoyltransferase complex dimerization subunit type 1 TsaB [Actinomycetia bacterium]|nr:tRNA (adenosine(37)-N6)-threonylcarbamoyltransferase complex dimerization subunit type 1 TsaB [Actinomycetes bacterium]
MAGAVLSLAVTSSTAVVGVAVGPAGGEALSFNQVSTDRRHAEELTPLIASTVAAAGVSLTDIEQYVVDVGPGRFTGLRVGLATVRALALATGRPVIGMTSLETLAAGEVQAPGPVLAVIDARRAEVFQQRFEITAGAGSDPAFGSSPSLVGRPEGLAPDWESAEAESLVIVGDGADRYGELYGPRVVPDRAPSAAVMVTISGHRAAVPGSEVSPLYLRDPDVNINVKTRHTPR